MATDTWREKIGSTLITIALTALGAIAFQSLKFLAVDYKASLRASQAAYRDSMAAQKKFNLQWERFDKVVGAASDRAIEREKLLTNADFITNQHNGIKVDDSLLQAYDDLGSVSYAPVTGAPMETKRATLVEVIKSEINGLETVKKWQDKTPLSLADRLKANRELQRNLYLCSGSLSAHSVALENLQAEFDDKNTEGEAALDRYQHEQNQRERWLITYMIAAFISTMVYLFLLSYITSSVRTGQETNISTRSSAQFE